jgi:hypothetical protein
MRVYFWRPTMLVLGSTILVLPTKLPKSAGLVRKLLQAADWC